MFQRRGRELQSGLLVKRRCAVGDTDVTIDLALSSIERSLFQSKRHCDTAVGPV